MGVMHIPGHSHQAPREVALEEIEAVLGDCHLCQLYQSRHNIVFGVGNPRAREMFLGEAPGRNEDLQGEPFVGAAGEDLNGILSLAGLKREDVYIANVLKCRPRQVPPDGAFCSNAHVPSGSSAAQSGVAGAAGGRL